MITLENMMRNVWMRGTENKWEKIENNRGKDALVLVSAKGSPLMHLASH